ncbi:MAG: hypothetical protein OJF47_002939 [Nitrospira sp.]|jgi:hypothetical protein|nr:MAG: hypothetical protein OJF47_002939 [Nitrospira sp.]
MPGPNHRGAHLDNLSRALLRLHKALLDGERVTYERVHGRIQTNGAFFQLVLGDAWFAWLRPLSQMMARLDELAEGKESADDAEITALIASMRTLLTPSEEGDGFGRHYYDALQREPDVGLAHAAVRGLLR